MPPVSDERLAELTDRLETGIKELYASGRYAEYLAAMSKFHRYSYKKRAAKLCFNAPPLPTLRGTRYGKRNLNGR